MQRQRSVFATAEMVGFMASEARFDVDPNHVVSDRDQIVRDYEDTGLKYTASDVAQSSDIASDFRQMEDERRQKLDVADRKVMKALFKPYSWICRRCGQKVPNAVDT